MKKIIFLDFDGVITTMASRYSLDLISGDDGEKEFQEQLKEELKEFTIGLGAEYWYNQVFTVRAGFFHEAQMKGNRRYVTLGAGLRYNVFALDVSYLVPVNNTATSGQNPLENTLRFSLTFNIDKWSNGKTQLEKVN
jgi:hypothetical protein